MRKVYVVGPEKHYSKWLYDHTLVDKVEDADIVLFTGGEDVDPSLYDCEKHPTTHSNIRRDLREKAIFEKVRPDQACIGICRGSQFLCVMNGGKLVQNIGGHAMFGTHEIRSFLRSSTYEITSTHHQMQYPFNLKEHIDYTPLFYSRRRLSIYYEGDGIEEPPYEPEIILYHREGKPKCLAIQGHPEMMVANPNTPIIPMLNKLVDDYLC